MRVLVLPHNYGSMPSITIDALRRKGIDARGLTYSHHQYQYLSPNMINAPIDTHGRRLKKIPKYLSQVYAHYKLLDSMLEWCDVVHWMGHFYMAKQLDFKLLKKHNKPGIVEFVGSDIRNPDVLRKINPYYKSIYDQNLWEYANVETAENSNHLQSLFHELNFVPGVCPEMSLFINESIFGKSKYLLMQRFDVNSYIPSYPSSTETRPVILHSPSAKHTKGTRFIEEAIQQLKGTYDFEYRTLHNLPRNEVLNLMGSCDIFIDQLIGGGYGTASMEAMSMGKPVIAYIMPELFKNGLPKDAPFVNANPDTIKTAIASLLNDAELRHTTGKASRDFVVKYHNADTIADDLIGFYNQLIQNKNQSQ